MRIIAGSAKGRNIRTPKGSDVIRPALAQVREAIFSSLGDVEGWHFWDVFAGTGSLGLEALSRGAEHVTFFDAHPEAIKLLVENLKMLGFSDRATILRRRLPADLDRIKVTRKPDVIFCDPPYDKNLLNPTLSKLATDKLVDPQTLLIVEHTKREMPVVPGLEVVKTRAFGQTLVTTLRPINPS